MINRRGFLSGLIAVIAAPAIVRPGLIMPIKPIIITPALYPGELNLLQGWDLVYWVEELGLKNDPYWWHRDHWKHSLITLNMAMESDDGAQGPIPKRQ